MVWLAGQRPKNVDECLGDEKDKLPVRNLFKVLVFGRGGLPLDGCVGDCS
jgi:hypothetical protein